MPTSSLAHRLSRGGAHLLLSFFAAALVAVLVFGVWYPAPFRDLSGGLTLFGILVGVDLLLGPLATVVVSKPGKSQREWRLDVSLIVFIQLGALSYGLWTMYQARPVHLAFEIDRMRVVNAVDVDVERLPMAPAGLQALPIGGPGLVAVRPFTSSNESVNATLAALQGVELGFRPDFWMPYDQARESILTAAKPLTELTGRKPEAQTQLNAALTSNDLNAQDVLYLPLHARGTFWTALISATDAKPVAYIPLDPY